MKSVFVYQIFFWYTFGTVLSISVSMFVFKLDFLIQVFDFRYHFLLLTIMPGCTKLDWLLKCLNNFSIAHSKLQFVFLQPAVSDIDFMIWKNAVSSKLLFLGWWMTNEMVWGENGVCCMFFDVTPAIYWMFLAERVGIGNGKLYFSVITFCKN